MPTYNSIRLLSCLLACLGMVSCATVSQTISIAPVETSFPVSASQALLVDDTIISDGSFKEREKFVISQTVKKPIGVKEFSLDLDKTLEAQLAGTRFKGITQLKIEVKDINNLTATLVAFERNIAFWTGSVGVLYFSYTAGLPTKNGGGNYLPGVVILGMAGGLLGGSYLHESFGTIDYQLDVSGVKVSY